MFREALGYPTRPPAGGRAILVGGGLLVVVFGLFLASSLDTRLAPLALAAVVPWLLVRGYYVRVIRTTIGRDRPAPPRFGDLGRLFADGFAALFVAVGYLLPAAVVLGPLAYGRVLEADLTALLLEAGVPDALGAAALSVVGVLAVAALMYLIGALYALPVAVANFAYTGRLRAAFDLRTVLAGAVSEDYAVAWVVSMLLQALLLPFAYLLRVVLAGFALQFLVAVAVRYCYGQGVGAALRLDALESEGVDRESTDRERGQPAFVPVDGSAADGPWAAGGDREADRLPPRGREAPDEPPEE